jgi:hypothetical protein
VCETVGEGERDTHRERVCKSVGEREREIEGERGTLKRGAILYLCTSIPFMRASYRAALCASTDRDISDLFASLLFSPLLSSPLLYSTQHFTVSGILAQ